MRRILLTLLFFPVMAVSDNSSLNLSLPSSNMNHQSDKFRAGDMDCSNAVGGATNFEFGMMGIVDNASGPFSNNDPMDRETKDIGVYARITIPLDKPRERINCNTLYQLELRARRLEVEKLELELEQLRNMRFENSER
jgi:hypothetical protein